MENKEQRIKMLVTDIGNETKRAESIDAAISKVTVELIALKKEFERKHSEAWTRFITLLDAKGCSKEYIENCQKELEELRNADVK